MKKFSHALCVFLFAATVLHAQPDEDEALGDVLPLDDDLILYVPKYTVRLGFRALDGAGASFGGKSVIASDADIGNKTDTVSRLYHDGYVANDARVVTNPSGGSSPITPDGRTNTWAFSDSSQVSTDGLISFSTYKATTTDASMRENDTGLSYGVELAADYDFGSVFGTRLKWGATAGMSINQIFSSAKTNVAASIEKVTDIYSLHGQAAPTAPYTAPVAVGSVDISVLLDQQVLDRSTSTSTSADAILNQWRVRGAYITFRAGPTLFLPITSRLSATMSTGAVLVYSGTTYDVVSTFKPQTGDSITESVSDGASTILPGFYVDANLQYVITDTAGLYLGAVYQNSGDYTQRITSTDGESTYATRVDLSALQGVRAGVSFKF